MNNRRTFRWAFVALAGLVSSLLTALVMWAIRPAPHDAPEPSAPSPRPRPLMPARHEVPHAPPPAGFLVGNLRFAGVLVGLALLASVAGWLGHSRATARQARTLASSLTGGNPDKGESAIATYGCASCHTIPGIRGANALVGPPLTQLGSRSYIGGVLTNTPTHLMRWIQNPPGINPQTAMPNIGVTDPDARDIAAYLYTLQ